jgi:hypothetical protein
MQAGMLPDGSEDLPGKKNRENTELRNREDVT